MKKIVAILFAVMIMMLSTMVAFAESVNSPVATTQPETQATTAPVENPDRGNVSPKTGEINSPVATTQPETQPATTVSKPDNNNTSPKTGSSDMIAYTLIALSVIGCGVASVALVKTAKKN